MEGAVSGAAIGLLGPTAGACGSLGMAMGMGAAEAALQNILAQLMNVIGGGQDDFNWKSFFQDTIMGAVTGALSKALGLLCFDGDTAVNVPSKNGFKIAANKGAGVVASETVAIKTIKAGDKVFARDEKTGNAKVNEVFKRTSDHLITLELAASKGGKVVETLKTTRQHPFYVDGKGWLPAGGLAIGNSIVPRAGLRLFVKSIKWNCRTEGYTVYNFEVEALSGKEADGKNTHSYFIGKTNGGAWVHNRKYEGLVPLNGVGQDFGAAMKQVAAHPDAAEAGAKGLRGPVLASGHNGGGKLAGSSRGTINEIERGMGLDPGDSIDKKRQCDGGWFKVWFRRDTKSWDITHFISGDELFRGHGMPYVDGFEVS